MLQTPREIFGGQSPTAVRAAAFADQRKVAGAEFMKVNGRKRHLLVDTLDLVMAIKVHEADIQDRAGAILLLRDLPNVFPRMQHVWADAGYAGKLTSNIKTYLGWTLEIVKHPWSGWQGSWAPKAADRASFL